MAIPDESAKLPDIKVEKPRTCGRQRKKGVDDVQNSKDFYRVSAYIPLLNSMKEALKTLFLRRLLNSLQFISLLPKKIINYLNAKKLQHTK